MSRIHPFNRPQHSELTLTLFRKQTSRCCTFNLELKQSETEAAAGHVIEGESVLRLCKSANGESTIDPSEQQLCNSTFLEAAEAEVVETRTRSRQQAGKGLLAALLSTLIISDYCAIASPRLVSKYGLLC